VAVRTASISIPRDYLAAASPPLLLLTVEHFWAMGRRRRMGTLGTAAGD